MEHDDKIAGLKVGAWGVGIRYEADDWECDSALQECFKRIQDIKGYLGYSDDNAPYIFFFFIMEDSIRDAIELIEETCEDADVYVLEDQVEFNWKEN